MATILIVDDRAVNRKLIATILSYENHAVLEAGDGREALALVQANPPDLIISDVLMPVMDGFEFARQIRALPDLGAMPILFSSAHYLSAESRALAEACGVRTILTKPAEPKVILGAVAEALRGCSAVNNSPDLDRFNYEHLRLITDKLAQRNDELRATNLQVTNLIQLGQQMIREHEPSHLIAEYCNAAREIIGAKCAGLGLLNDEGLRTKKYCASDFDPEIEAQIVSHIESNGIIDRIVQRGESLRFHDSSGKGIALGMPASLPPILSFLGVPIASASHTYGWLCLANKLGADQFFQQDEELLVLLAAQLAVTYENTRLYEQAKQRTEDLEREISERKHAEETLRESELRYRTLAETANDGIFICSTDGKMQYINTEGAKWLDMSPEAVIGKFQHELFPAITASENLRKVAEVCRTGEALYDESQRPLKGKEGWHSTWLVPIRNKDGEISSIMGLARDITEQKRAHELGSYLASIVTFSDDAIVGKTLDGIITSWNAAAERIYGYAEEEVKGRHISMLAPPQRAGEIEEILRQLSRGETVRHFETERVRKDGQIIDVSLSVSSIKDSEGNIAGSSTIARDITERKRAELENVRLLAQVQDQKLRIDAIVTNVPGVVWEAWGRPDESSQRIDFVSDYVEEMLGYSVQEWTSTPNFWLTIVHPDDKQRAASEASAIYAGGGRGTTLFRWIAKDGHVLWTEAFITVVCDADGNPIGMRGVSLDVTERKRAEEEILKAHNLALETSRIKAEFLANMSHELRTPMNGILGFTDLLLDTDPSDEQREYLNLVKISGDSLLKLINNILSLSEPHQPKLDQEFCLEECVRQTVTEFSGDAERNGLDLIYQIAPDVPALLTGDCDRVCKVLSLLLDNAIKFTEQGEIEATIAQESVSPDGVVLRFSIRDTGAGISADRQEIIFDPFMQADGSLNRRHGGAGVGLAMCRQMVEMLGGRIWVESELGFGSTFHFTARFGVSELSSPEHPLGNDLGQRRVESRNTLIG